MVRGERILKKEFLDLAALFEKAYQEKYLVSRLPNSIDISSFKLTISSTALKLPYNIDEAHTSRQNSTKRAFDPDTHRFRSFQVLSRYSLKKDDKIKGPALIQEVESTTVLPSKSIARVDQFRNLVVEMVG
jgi:N-methylhydantoinase A/oxoprolinase/acetone carboxylase beta subunit